MARILVLGKETDDAKGLARLLRRDGHRTDVARTETAARKLLLGRRPDLLVLAVPDPPALLRGLGKVAGQRIRRTPAIAVLPEGGDGCYDSDFPGLLDLLSTPFADESFLARVDALLRVREVLFGDEDSRNGQDGGGFLRRLIAGLLSPGRSWRRSRQQRPLEPYLQTAATIVETVEDRDAFDPGHGQRVAAHCAAMARTLGLREDETEILLVAASIHDIGKIALSAEMLRKPTLTEADRLLMKAHPRRGAELIRALTPYREAAEVVLYHHERPDGKGYYALPPEQVPDLSEILAVADALDGMTTSRRAGAPLSPSEAIENLREGSGKAFDEDCVEALASAMRPQSRRTVPVSALDLGTPSSRKRRTFGPAGNK